MRDTKTALTNYLAWVVREYNHIHVLGMAKPMELANIYTDVYVLDTPKPFRHDDLAALNEQYRRSEWEKPQAKSKRLSGVEAVQRNRKLFVLGGPGAGKTTFLRYLAVQAAKGLDNPQIPVFVALKQWANSELKLIDFVIEQFEMGGFEVAKPFVEEQLRAGNLLLLFDGLDELPSSQAFYDQITFFAKQYNQNAIVLSCRLAANKFFFEKFAYVQMAEFDPKQIKTFVRRWFGTDEKTSNTTFAVT